MMVMVMVVTMLLSSGPKRFDYVATEGKWLDTREREPLHQLLYAELEQLTGVSLS